MSREVHIVPYGTTVAFTETEIYDLSGTLIADASTLTAEFNLKADPDDASALVSKTTGTASILSSGGDLTWKIESTDYGSIAADTIYFASLKIANNNDVTINREYAFYFNKTA